MYIRCEMVLTVSTTFVLFQQIVDRLVNREVSCDIRFCRIMQTVFHTQDMTVQNRTRLAGYKNVRICHAQKKQSYLPAGTMTVQVTKIYSTFQGLLCFFRS